LSVSKDFQAVVHKWHIHNPVAVNWGGQPDHSVLAANKRNPATLRRMVGMARRDGQLRIRGKADDAALRRRRFGLILAASREPVRSRMRRKKSWLRPDASE